MSKIILKTYIEFDVEIEGDEPAFESRYIFKIGRKLKFFGRESRGFWTKIFKFSIKFGLLRSTFNQRVLAISHRCGIYISGIYIINLKYEN